MKVRTMTNDSKVDGYLEGLPGPQRERLEEVRRVIQTAAPDATESISYIIPTYKYRGKPLVYFGAAKKHWGLYGAAADAYPEVSERYETSKGTIKFPWDEPVPVTIVEMVVRDRMTKIEAASGGRRGADAPKDTTS